ncbi:hypothetical protein QCA50_001501 [Cerrena zonata]|uniref:SAC domain-containing protein n=1 Tax=Cerrena zonata TaxID=2478898 RepID=A0AAW0GR56_9APHY
MDNLDRTNVAQAAIAKWTLNRQLKALGILQENDNVENYEDLNRDFREMWSDHANLISLAYAGSGALKTEFTRTGKMSVMGQLEDGQKSVTRYLKNNFFDGARQDAYDLMTGAWVPKRNWSPSSLVADRRPLVIRAMPYLLWFSVFMILAGLTLPRSSDYSLLYYFLFWFSLVTLSLSFIISHGLEYVNWPRLISLDDTINYDGPGFRKAFNGRGFGIPALDTKVKNWTSKRKVKSRLDEIEMGSKIRVD